jgi:hypothetical protein
MHLDHLMTSLRRALATALLPLLSACTAIIPIDVVREVTLEAPAAGAFEKVQVIDLSTTAAVWNHRDQVDAVSVDDVTATVLSVGAGQPAASLDLTIGFRPDGAPADGSQDRAVGTLPSLPLVAGATASLHGSSTLDAFLLSVLKGTGRFAAVASGQVSGPAGAVLQVEVRGSAAYRVGR